MIQSGSWLLQTPRFGGYAATAAYLPSKKIAIALAVTFGERGFDAQGGNRNRAEDLFRQIGARLAPDDPPPGARP